MKRELLIFDVALAAATIAFGSMLVLSLISFSALLRLM